MLKAWAVVKQKGAAGGVDGVTITHFDENVGEYLKQLKQDLIAGQWNPEPYLRITIPKKENERRKLGLLSIKDKVVQQAIKQLIEPRFEKIFVSNSYAYRPEKGHTKAIRFTHACCRNKKYPFILRLDIDNFFDTIDHDILFRRIRPVVPDEELLRLIQLCVKMGVVSKKMKWEEVKEGKENEATELIINTYGTYIGVCNKGITVKVYGKQQPMPPTQNLQHNRKLPIRLLYAKPLVGKTSHVTACTKKQASRYPYLRQA